MDWLGGLSNIKGQITNLTKDLLAEGTSELSDPKSELDLARAHITELQTLIDAQKTEILSLKNKNDELQVQLESAELRLDHTREQFQIQIREKEAIITKLRSEMTSERGEPEGQSATLVQTFSMAGRKIDQLELASEEHEPVEGSSHDGKATWQELRNEVAELRSEVAKWRRIAKQKKAKDKELTNLQDSSTHELEKEIGELRQKLLDTEELRQAELTALRDTHNEHMNDLFNQLRETEAEVLSLRAQLEETTAQLEASRVGAVSHSPVSTTKAEHMEESPSPDPNRAGPKKKQRPTKKRKPKPQADSRVQDAEVVQSIQEPVLQKEYQEIAVQCHLLDFTPDTSTDFEKVDPPSSHMHTPTSEIAVDELQAPVTTHTVAVQQETETFDNEIQTDPEPVSVLVLDTASVSCQTSPVSSHADEFSFSESCLVQSSSGVTTGDDGRSQISDTSDVSVCSRHLDDLVHQLAEEIHSYENVMDEVMSTVSKRLAGPLTQPSVSSDLDAEEIAQRLATFQVSLKQRRDRLAAIRKRNRRKPVKTDDSQPLNRELSEISTASEPLGSRSSSVVIPSMDTSLSVRPADAVEADTDGWHDDDFPDDLRLTQLVAPKPPSSVTCHGDEKKTQTIHKTESTETLVSDLRNTIQELETRLSVDALANKSRVEELEDALKPAERIHNALRLAVQQLAAELPGPPPLPPRSPSLSKDVSPPPPWPPIDPEAQLAMIVGLERAASDQAKRLHKALDSTQKTLDSLTAENEELQRQLMELRDDKQADRAITEDDGFASEAMESKSNQKPPEQQCASALEVEGEDISDIAYRLCLSLDPDYNEQSWDPDQWDYLLYELLKTRFDEGPTSMDPAEAPDERVVQLSAEVAALRDILGQHAAFRSQAEHDLRQLLATVSSQRAQLDELTAQKEQLTDELDQIRRQHEDQPIHSRQDESDELSRTAIHQLSELVRTKEEEVERLERRCNDLTELIRSAHVRLTNQSDASADTMDEDVTAVLDRLTREWSEAKTRADRAEAMYESVLSTLEQKHAESQAYHNELQRVYTELATANELCQSFQKEASDLRDKLISLQTKASPDESNAVESQGHAHDAVHEEVILPETSVNQTSSAETVSNTNEAKLLAELQRLQAHLLEMEESYTTEALNAEAREVDLRSQLHRANERLEQLEESCQTVEQRVSQAQTERDEAHRVNETYQREVAALKTNLANLQSVLDSFQQNQQSAVTAEVEHIRLELQRARQNESALRAELDRVMHQVADRNQLEEQTRQMSMQIQRHNSQVDRIRAQVDERDAQIDSLRNRLAQMAVDTDSKIDKVLIKNLLLSYFQLPSSQRQSGLRVIGSLLQFTDEEYRKAGSSLGAIPALFNWVRNAVSNIPAGPPKDVTFASSYPDKSFTELLLAFLEQEAGLRSPMKLSMDYYTPEAVRPNNSLRHPSQPDSELDESYPHSWSHSALMTPSTSASQPTENANSQPPLNPLFQM